MTAWTPLYNRVHAKGMTVNTTILVLTLMAVNINICIQMLISSIKKVNTTILVLTFDLRAPDQQKSYSSPLARKLYILPSAMMTWSMSWMLKSASA